MNNRQFINFFCSLSSKLLQLQTFFILVHKPWPRLCTTLKTSTKCHTNGGKVAHVQVLLLCQKFQKFSLELKWTGLFWFGLVTRIFGMSTLTGLTNWSNASLLFTYGCGKHGKEHPFVWPVSTVKCCSIFIGKFHWSLANQSGIIESTPHVR